MLNSFFKLDHRGTTVRREITAGVTTFLTMAYVVFVNPAILSEAGMDPGGVFVATCLAAAFGTAIMGLRANYPIAMAPGMGLNAFFTYGFVSYAAVKLLSGRHTAVKPAVGVLAVLFICKFVWLG